MKETYFLASTQDEIRDFPDAVRREVGYALYTAEEGGKALNVTPLIGFGGAGILEVISNHDGDTYRAVYTVRFQGALYVLHAFKKKSVRGIATPKKELDVIRRRLKWAEEHYSRSNQQVQENGRQKV